MATVHPHSMAVATATVQAVEAQLRYQMIERDARLVARFGERVTGAREPRALLTPTGRVIASQPDGWVPAMRLHPPAGGGRMSVGDGQTVTAETLGFEEAYLIRAAPTLAAHGRPAAGPVITLSLLGRDRAEAEIAGERHQLRLRHSEILTLLCARPAGMTSEELSIEIYGDPDGAAAIRVEISRLRKLLGDCIEPEHYRLTGVVGSDVARVCALLHRGEVREAAARYPGALLTGSDAPGVVREREALEQWLRQSILTAGDQEALWGWLQTDSGAADLTAWQRLLTNLPFHDPRRSLAATRVTQLRTLL
jgi:hypothetical protein